MGLKTVPSSRTHASDEGLGNNITRERKYEDLMLLVQLKDGE